MASEGKAEENKESNESKDSGEVPDKEVATQWLLDEGFDPDLPRYLNRYGETAWDVACRKGRTDMCRWLHSENLDDMMNIPDQVLSRTPLFWAIWNRRETTAKWMMAHGALVEPTETDVRRINRMARALQQQQTQAGSILRVG
mmetsp:Transcript_4049/g.8428  ORF Transcript_4049/g.8428 Transcript_4049/m.8428 type:complete len:143 (+) Transcript_4049:260-688(+)